MENKEKFRNKAVGTIICGCYTNKDKNRILEEKSYERSIHTNEEGKQAAVIVPIEEWKQLKAANEKLQNKLDILGGLQDALKEVQEIKQGKRKKGRTLGEFLSMKYEVRTTNNFERAAKSTCY